MGKDDEFNIWRDLFGYLDEDYDGDVDWADVDIADHEYEVIQKKLDSKIKSIYDDEYDMDLDYDGQGFYGDDDMGLDDDEENYDDYLGFNDNDDDDLDLDDDDDEEYGIRTVASRVKEQQKTTAKESPKFKPIDEKKRARREELRKEMAEQNGPASAVIWFKFFTGLAAVILSIILLVEANSDEPDHVGVVTALVVVAVGALLVGRYIYYYDILAKIRRIEIEMEKLEEEIKLDGGEAEKVPNSEDDSFVSMLCYGVMSAFLTTAAIITGGNFPAETGVLVVMSIIIGGIAIHSYFKFLDTTPVNTNTEPENGGQPKQQGKTGEKPDNGDSTKK